MEFYELTPAQAAEKLNTDLKTGLTDKEAKRRLAAYGRNKLTDKKKKSVLMRFFEQFNDFMIVILLTAAAASFITSVVFGNSDITEALIILAIITLNAALGTAQEIRAEHSLQALQKLSAPTATVIRNSKEQKINSELIVPGDIVRLSRGDIASADCRLITASDFTVSEAALTGEANEVKKNADIIHEPLTAVGDIKNMVMASCPVCSGNAIGIAVCTGMDTEVGKIASMLIDTQSPKTPLQNRLAEIGKTLGCAALTICGIIFIIGTVKQIPPLEMFMTSVSLAVAAIPEGLPAIVTILLALGVVRMSKHNAIVRHLPSVETLGCATVICTDKTGTLTHNNMKVSQVKTNDFMQLLRLSVLCSEDGDYINPTDKAICDYAYSNGINVSQYHSTHKVSSRIAFDSARKRMSVAADGNIIVKGALEYILPLCSRYKNSTKSVPLSHEIRRKILSDNKKMTDNALRVIAVAYRNDSVPDLSDETNLTFVGLIGICDPPRPEAKSAVRSARNAGIRTIMVTGDHINTAIAIAKSTDICDDTEHGITGREIEDMTDEELSKAVKTHTVFARTTPEHKLRIIKALKRNGEITAMTGDGVNDAPALRGADIGCSMGINGTDVAKSASDIVLTDDNFATIVYAVKEGRTIYENIRKSVKFLLSSNIGEILTVTLGIIFSKTPPLTAIELLWVNLITDSLPAIALGLDPISDSIMQKKPEKQQKGFFSPALWASITLEGLMIGALALLAYQMGLFFTHHTMTAQTMAFFTLSVSQLTHAFNMRTNNSVIKDGLFKNKYLVISFIGGIAIQLMLIYVAPLAALFKLSKLSPLLLITTIALSLMPLLIVEIQKCINSYVTKNRI